MLSEIIPFLSALALALAVGFLTIALLAPSPTLNRGSGLARPTISLFFDCLDLSDDPITRELVSASNAKIARQLRRKPSSPYGIATHELLELGQELIRKGKLEDANSVESLRLFLLERRIGPIPGEIVQRVKSRGGLAPPG